MRYMKMVMPNSIITPVVGMTYVDLINVAVLTELMFRVYKDLLTFQFSEN